MESIEAARDATLAVAWSWTGLEGGSDRAGLCPPSESLPWLLGGVGGKCRGSTAKWQQRQKVTQGFKVPIQTANTATTTTQFPGLGVSAEKWIKQKLQLGRGLEHAGLQRRNKMQQLSLGLTDKTGLCAYAPVTSTYTSAPSSNAFRFM